MANQQLSDAAPNGHVSRSRFLDAFALVEIWTTRKARALLGSKFKATAPLSHKLKAIRADVSSDCSRFLHPEHVSPLLDQIAKFAELRANLVHSKLYVATLDDGSYIWLFRNCSETELPSNKFSEIQTQESMDAAMVDLHELGRKLENQKLKPPLPAPASPGASSARS